MAVPTGFADGTGQVVDDLAVGVVESEAAENQLVVGPHQGLEDEGADFFVARVHGNGDIQLQHLAVVRDGPSGFVNGRFTAHGEADEFLAIVDVALDPVLLAVSDQAFEGCDGVIHTMSKTRPEDRVQTEVCHTGRGPECAVLPRGRLVAAATYLRFATVRGLGSVFSFQQENRRAATDREARDALIPQSVF